MPTPFQSLGTIDSSSDRIVLTYVEGKQAPDDVPTRDLHGGDLRRIAWTRENARVSQGRGHLIPHGEEAPETELPQEPDARALRSLAADLVETGAFRVTHPVKTKTTTDQPDPPTPDPGDTTEPIGDGTGEALPPNDDAPGPPAQPED